MRIKKLWQSEFRVLSPFVFEKGKSPAVGDIITLSDPAMETDLVSRGLIEPTDLPPIGIYIALRDFELPGFKEKFSAKMLDRVELKKKDALALMLHGFVLPTNDEQRRPHGRRLRDDLKAEPPLNKPKSFLKNWHWQC